MSGFQTVAEVLSTARIIDHSPADLVLLQSLGLCDKEGNFDKHRFNLLKTANETQPNAIVYVRDNGDLEFVGKTETSETADAKPITKTDPVSFSVSKLKEVIEGKTFSIDQEKVKETLEKYIKDLPRTAESYSSESIEIMSFKGVEISISSLLSAGTKILDAILYLTYKDSIEQSAIFKVKELNPKTIIVSELQENINIGNKSIKAAFCCVYNQGSLPSKTSEDRNLSKFIKETLFRDSKLTSQKFASHLSSSDPTYFPASIFLKISFDHLPSEVASRCKMAVAGNKAIRYAILAKRFEQNSIPDRKDMSTEEMRDHMNQMTKLEKAIKITETLSTLGSNFEAQKRMHPLSTTRQTRKNFSLQLTCAIVHSLSPRGRAAMRKEIEEKNIAAFKRDDNIFGKKNALDEVFFPVLTSSDADFSELSVEAVKAAYGLTG
jgi:hypothetical protein